MKGNVFNIISTSLSFSTRSKYSKCAIDFRVFEN